MPRRHTPLKPQRYHGPSCHGKRRYASEAAAQLAAELQELATPNLELHTYRCPICSGWHLTHKLSYGD